jgi:hypothetical protein
MSGTKFIVTLERLREAHVAPATSQSLEEVRMRLVKTGLMAAALVIGYGTAASAQSVEVRTRSVAPGHMVHDDDEVSSTRVIRRSTGTVQRRIVREPSTTATVTTRRGASYYAPGQVKKRVKVQSARDYAPGHMVGDDGDTTTTTTVRRRVRTLD